MTMSEAPPLPTIPASPGTLSPTTDDDDEEDFGRVAPGDASPGRKRRLDQHQQHGGAGVDGGANPYDSLQCSAFSPQGGPIAPGLDASIMSGYGSWYFQPPPPGVGGQPGGPLPPHLAYWMQYPAMGNVSDLTYQGGSFGGLAGGALAGAAMGGEGGGGGSNPDLSHLLPPEEEYKVYSTRWIMLGYMSLLNLLSDWTCYSVAPIAILTQQAFGDVDPESLVTVFLGANAVASALEPMILGRLGLRRTVIFGAMLLMAGSIVKSGGLRSVMVGSDAKDSPTEDGESDETWRLYLGFFLVGLSQPLYQCTPALLSASWFPENERTMATGVALNSNQLGIGCAFVFGTLLVSTEDDIIPYFGLLSVIATITFVGAALQFDDAPPTPPSDTARVIRGDLEIKIPKLPFGLGGGGGGGNGSGGGGKNKKEDKDAIKEGSDEDGSLKGEKVAEAPAPASTEEAVEVTLASIHDVEKEMSMSIVGAPSPAPMDEPVANKKEEEDQQQQQRPLASPPPFHAQPNHPLASPGGTAPSMGMASPPYPNPYPYMPPPGFYPYPVQMPSTTSTIRHTSAAPVFYHGYDQQGHYHNALLESSDGYGDYRTSVMAFNEEGVEPVMTQAGHQLDIDIRDDQLVQQFKACFRRKGFSHCVVAFTTSGIIVNTLSTFMDYLVTLNGAGREYVGIVGGTFQMLIMCASLVFGGWTDHSRKYYFVTLAMLIFGAFALAVCNVNLDSNAGGDLRLNLLIVAVLAGPLQPISTELGVEVVYPLSENTVLVIQQLFSNLLSAAFIPVFKALRDVGKEGEVPQYTFSFYMLIIIHAGATCYFATFNGTYLRYEAELDKKAKKVEERAGLLADLQQEHGYGTVEPN